jgi:lysophospholipase
MDMAASDAPTLVNLPSNPVPEGARVAMFQTRDRIRLRYATFPRQGTVNRGTVCLVQGRTEFIEKYFETVADFQKRGFHVATFDWRGQGGSERLVSNPLLGYVEEFDDYWEDLASFHGAILLPDCPPPYYLVGHSMGGLVSLLAATRDRLMFDRVFVSAPMVALDRQLLGMRGMARLTETLCFLGLSRMPARRKYDETPSQLTFPDNPLTGDETRYMRAARVLEAAPQLRIAAPTYRWSASAFEAMAAAGRDAFPASLKIPVLMLAGARDEVVSSAAIEQLGLRMRTGRHVMIAAARHELFMETDPIRGQVLAAFDAFITEQSG